MTPLKSKFFPLSWTHTHVNPIIKTNSVLDIFRYNNAAKKYRKEEKRKAAVGTKGNESSDDDEGPTTSRKNQRKDQSESDEDLLAPSSESSTEEEKIEDSHRFDRPREIYRGGLSDLMNDQGLFCFVEHYLGWEGCMRNKRATDENAQRVARLLYQVDPRLRDPSRLWRAEDVRTIRKCFFEGNSSLPKPRKPGTLKAHIHSYRMFLQFVDNPGVDISKYVALEDGDRQAIRDTREKLSGWLRCLIPLTHKRKAEVQKEDLGEVLGQQEYNELMAGSTAKEMIKEFSNLQADYMTNSTDFVRLRDLIILRLLLVSAQRPGAVANLTM